MSAKIYRSNHALDRGSIVILKAAADDLLAGPLCRPTLAVLIGCFLFLPSTPLYAGTAFGIYDARTLAMGGASVAAANNDNAQFYNSALLAFNEEIEERTTDSRFLFPILIPQISDAAVTLENVASDDMADAVSLAVGNFNEMVGAISAQQVFNAAADLDSALAEIDGEDLFADIYIGLAVSEPGKFQGAGFFLGTRVLAGGGSRISAADRAVLSAYQEGLLFVASGGTQGVARPELFDANGALIDPGNSFESSVAASGALITEAGVAMSRQLHLFGQPIAAGVTFKVQRVDTFEDAEQISNERIDIKDNRLHRGKVNLDLGFVRAFGDRWRLGLAIKDVIPTNYKTSLGTPIRFRPRARMGAAFQSKRLQLTADIDLTESEPLGIEAPTRELAVGAEWGFSSPLKLRAGYRHYIQGNRDAVASIGIGTIWRRLAVDVAYAAGNDSKAAALQFGIVF